MALRTPLAKRLGIDYPIIQAPLAGGGDTPSLVAAVGNAGGLGIIGAAYLSPAQIVDAGKAVRALTSRRFGINLFAPLPAPDPPADFAPSLQSVAPFYAELGLDPPTLDSTARTSFAEQLDASLETDASVFSFTFGLLPPAAVDAIKSRGLFLMGTATTVEEARTLERSGVDAVVTQGSEAGGHRGTFAGDFDSAMVGTISLVPQIVDAVRVPVVASGGIMDGRGLAAALALGANAVQMGTAFLTCDESGAPGAYRDAILRTLETQTRVTRAFSGRPARGIVNRFMQHLDPASILPFPLQNALTRPLRTAAAQQGRAEFLSLWAGQSAPLARRQSAAELIARIVTDAEGVIGRLAEAVIARLGSG